ncbi:hypothetical protein M408DRAFT_138671 [Serendipita vermifera MAFF 305830]|uniref:PNPLA domain-containing protein n=1 Tax=Serendipita vermifera MAFF 305830 TaxID=933852 RepID=A0A0C3A6V8_SERVB|nr:hypothetical protein M408DRAFT_138671 [Serendipita vermifera MAFF 305830]
MSNALRNNLKLLSLDGGGVRGFSQLETLRNIMHRLNWDTKSDGSGTCTLPCEHFDLIGGSGTGGLIAIFLTKLRMSVEEVCDEFYTITEQVYEPDGLIPSERTSRLRRCMEGILTRRGIPTDLSLLDETPSEGCAGFVVASLRSNIETNVCLRTYPIRNQPSSNITIIEAVLATCATQPTFSPVPFGARYKKREYIAAGFGANNPVREVIGEAHSLFGEASTVASLLSLGTGHPGIISWPLDSSELGLHTTIRDVMNDCEQRAQEIEERIGRVGIYSRFSVQQGMQKGHPGQVVDPEWITTQTESYLNEHHSGNKLDRFVKNATAKIGSISLDQLKHAGSTDGPDQLASSIEKSLGILISNQDDTIIAKLKLPDLECGSHASECLEGTCQDILAIIDAWVMENDAPNILWINGYPGIGKSAIATSIVEKWRSSKRLGSSFFFRREGADVMTPHALWRTVAYDLGRRYSAIRKYLVAALAEDEILPTIPHIDKLFRELIQNPLLASSDIPTERLPIIVIDALDECGGLDGRYSEHRKGLMRTLKSWSSLPNRFKLVVTSRRESDIKQTFSGIPHRSVSILAGQHASSQSSEDIRSFLQHELRQIVSQYPLMSPDWPGEKLIWSLTELASGLFIWVKTVLKLLERGELESTLEQILSGASGIASLYKCILNTSFPGPSDKLIQEFRSVLGAIIFAKTPLNVVSLAHLLSISNSVIGYICNGLYSVLDYGDNLRIHHQSFVDFIMDPNECPALFLIDRQNENRTLTMACLQTMKNHLRFNICNFNSSYVRNRDVPHLDSSVKARIPSYLSYSSCHWAGHLNETGFDNETCDGMEYFMSNQFLFWLEVLSLIGRVNVGSSMIRLLINWLKRFGQDDTLAVDMQKFIVAFASVISQSMPHIYISALPFAPRHLAVSRKYMKSHPKTLRIRFGGYKSWPAIQNVFNGHTSSVESVSFSPDGTRIVSGSDDRTIRVWDAETGETLTRPMKGHVGSVNSISFSPDGTRIASGSSDRTIRVWNVKTGKTLAGPFEGHTDWVGSVSFSPDGTCVISGSWDKTIRVWDAGTDGKRIASGSWYKTIRVWDVKTGETVLGPLKGPNSSIGSISFSPDGTRIASGSYDNTIKIWNAETGESATVLLEGHTDSVRSVSFSPDGARLVSGSSDNTIRVWDADTGETLRGPLEDHTGAVISRSFSPDGTRIASGSYDGSVRVWDAEIRDTTTRPMKGNINLAKSAAFSLDGTRIVSGSWDGIIRVWDAKTAELLTKPMWGHGGPVNSTSFSPDGTRIVSCSDDRTIRLRHAETGETVMRPLEGHTHWVRSVSFSPDGTRIASGSYDKTIRIWNAKTGDTMMVPLTGHNGWVNSVSFSPDGTRIASGSSDGGIRVWNVETGEMVMVRLKGHTCGVNSVSFSPDGTRIVAGFENTTIRVWNTKTDDTMMIRLEGHTRGVNSVSFSPDGTRIVSGSRDGSIRIWDVKTGKAAMGSLGNYPYAVNSVSFSPDGTRIVSSSQEGILRIYNLEAGYYTAYSEQIYSVFCESSWTEDGWILGPKSELLFWVPPGVRSGLHPLTIPFILGDDGTQLDLTKFVHGGAWVQCRDNSG